MYFIAQIKKLKGLGGLKTSLIYWQCDQMMTQKWKRFLF